MSRFTAADVPDAVKLMTKEQLCERLSQAGVEFAPDEPRADLVAKALAAAGSAQGAQNNRRSSGAAAMARMFEQQAEEGATPPLGGGKNSGPSAPRSRGSCEAAKRFEAQSSEKEERPLEISAPTNFKHITHIGWDEANGFEARSPSP